MTQKERMMNNLKHYTQLKQLEIREEILAVNEKENEKEMNIEGRAYPSLLCCHSEIGRSSQTNK